MYWKYPVKTLIDTYDISNDDDVLYNYPQLKNIIRGEDMPYGVCYDEVLGTYNEGISIGEAYGIVINEYWNIPIYRANEGDIILYSDKEDEILHFAKIVKTNGTIRGTIIRSKWGGFGIYETSLVSVPNIYGNTITIWRKKEHIFDEVKR